MLAGIKDESPSVFKKDWWAGKAREMAMADEDFKVRLFRFIDVLPYLTDKSSLACHINEYFCSSDQAIVKVVRWGLSSGLTSRIFKRYVVVIRFCRKPIP